MGSNILERILQPQILIFLIPIIAIITGGIIKIVKMLITHHERIAMIQHGIHPDYPPENDEVNRNNTERS